MSMISSQIDELRELAGDGSMEWAAGPIRASVLREAADTIWQLRDDLQLANAENAKLREEIEAAKHDLSVFSGRIVELDAENAKLRELVRGLHMAYVGALNDCEGMDAGLIWEHCEMVDAELAKSHARYEVDRHRFDVAMRELGMGEQLGVVCE